MVAPSGPAGARGRRRPTGEALAVAWQNRQPATTTDDDAPQETAPMTDPDIFERINALSAEEERLFEAAGDGSGLSPADVDRLAAIGVEPARAYALPPQREGKRGAGLDPPAATPRPAEIVEGYEQ